MPDQYDGDGFSFTVNELGIMTAITPQPRTAPIIESPDGTILIDQIEDTTLLSMVPNIVTPGTYGSPTAAAQITVDTYGRVTAASENPIVSSITLESNSGTIEIDEPVTGEFDINLEDGVVTPGTYGSASQAAQVTVDTYGRVTAASQNPLPTISSSTLTVAGGPAYTINTSTPSYARITVFNGYTGVTFPVTATLKEVTTANSLSAGWTLDALTTGDFSMATNGRLQYDGAATKSFIVDYSFNTNAGPNIQIAIYISGVLHRTVYSTPTAEAGGRGMMLSLNPGQYVSLWIAQSTSGGSLGIFYGQLSLLSTN